jgi:hypothetical protein
MWEGQITPGVFLLRGARSKIDVACKKIEDIIDDAENAANMTDAIINNLTGLLI